MYNSSNIDVVPINVSRIKGLLSIDVNYCIVSYQKIGEDLNINVHNTFPPSEFSTLQKIELLFTILSIYCIYAEVKEVQSNVM